MEPAPRPRLIRIKEAVSRTGRSRSRIYADLSAGNFPRPVKIGEKAIAFVEAEVDAWIADRIAARDRNPADA